MDTLAEQVRQIIQDTDQEINGHMSRFAHMNQLGEANMPGITVRKAKAYDRIKALLEGVQ